MRITPQFKILPVLILVAMFAFSVRLVDFATGVSSLSGSAFAEEEAMMEETMPDQSGLEAASETSKEEPADEMAMEDKALMDDALQETEAKEGWRDYSDDEFEYSTVTREVFEDMAARRKKLDRREKELMTREALIRAAEQELDRKYQELTTLRHEIESLLEQQSEEEVARIQSLVKIYETMKPKEAARIFDTLDLDVLVTVMSRMSERRLSPILANMNPERARTITIMLAEEKQLPVLPDSN